MLFNSYSFAIFFPIVTLTYFALPWRRRWAFLLLASCFFYAFAIPAYLLILFFLILIDYAAGLAIERAQGGSRRRWLVLSWVANLGLLGAFKYFNLAARTAEWALLKLHVTWAAPIWPWALPIGLSFHTFQSMAYTMEVYRGRVPAERNLGIYALYVLFYPQLVAGPIERPQHLLPQFRQEHRFEYVRVVRGLQLMAWGLFKKAAVADRLGAINDPVYALPVACRGPELAVATLLYALQIYADFSGYCDIARGAAEVMGFELMVNFRRPYFACSLTEFWHRWHISLSTWFRDYVYIPLGGNRGAQAAVAVRTLFVFALSGLWHGARWTFLAWGIFHGVALVVQRSCLKRVPWLKVRQALGWLSTVAVVGFAWIFFRAEHRETVRIILAHLPTGWDRLGSPWFAVVPLVPMELSITAAVVPIWLAIEAAQELGLDRAWVARQHGLVRWLLYYLLVGGILWFSNDTFTPFLYFQF